MNADTAAPEQAENTCFLSRRPLFDKDRRVVSHEIVVRSCLELEKSAAQSDVDAFSWLVTDGACELQQLMEEAGGLLICVPDLMLDAPEVHLLPKDGCQLVITADASKRADLQAILAFLKEFGYRTALRFAGSCQKHGPLLAWADAVILDLERLKPIDLAKERKFLKAFNVQALVDHVDTWEAFAGTKALGFDAFQGSFFGKPEVVKGRKLAANAVTRMELMGKLLDEESSPREYAAILAKDPLLSYRLLKYVNSPGVGAGRSVNSIEHAVTILGDTAFKHWAMMVLVASLDASPKGEELSYLCLQRASFLEKLAARGKAPADSRTMFMLGLFSLLDAMLGQPMAGLVTAMPMEPAVKAALCGEQNALAPWLALLDCMDQGRWPAVAAMLATHGVKRAEAAKDYMEASHWARACFQAGQGG